MLRGFKEFNYKPLGFVANDYAIVLWSLKEVKEIKTILNLGLLDKHLDNYLEETSIVKRLFRDNAIISCLIERRLPGMEKTGKQVLFLASDFQLLFQHSCGIFVFLFYLLAYKYFYFLSVGRFS